MKPFQLLIKPTSYDCNLRCKYCFYLPVEKQYPNTSHPRMSEQVLEQMISQYLRFRFPESIFGWQGGEPTLTGLEFFEQVVHFQQKYGAPGQIIGNALQTNGILINEDWGKFLQQYKFLVGLSLDGPKQIHDKYRRSIGGKSVWKKVMNAAEIFSQFQIPFNILCVVSRANISQIQKVYKFFKLQKFQYLQFIPALEVDTEGNKASFSINSRQYGRFLCDLFDLWKDDPQKPSIRLFDAFMAYYMGYTKKSCIFEESCAEYLLVEHNGDVYPCDFFVHTDYKLGNLLDSSFSEIKHTRDITFARFKSDLSEDCQHCNFLDLCYGGCIKDRKFPANPHPEKSYFCESYKQFFQHSNPWFQSQARMLKNSSE